MNIYTQVPGISLKTIMIHNVRLGQTELLENKNHDTYAQKNQHKGGQKNQYHRVDNTTAKQEK